jgi:hypothetical protein
MPNKKIKEESVHPFSVEELACAITGLDYDEIDADTATIEAKLMEEFNTDLAQFSTIIGRLMPLIMVAESPITKTLFKGFANIEESIWFIKSEVK